MRIIYVCLLLLFSTQLWSKDVKDFNKVLIQEVQKDINADNDQALKSKESIRRGPASVEKVEIVDESKIQEENKIDKNFRQIGSKSW